mgnify:CR=1 FL=1
MSNILLGSIDDNKNFIVENNEVVKDDKYLYLNLEKEKDIVCLFPTRTAFSGRILMPLLRKEIKRNIIVTDFRGWVTHDTCLEKLKQGYIITELRVDQSLEEKKEIIETLKNAKKYILYLRFEIGSIENKISKFVNDPIFEFLFKKLNENKNETLIILDEFPIFFETKIEFLSDLFFNKKNRTIYRLQNLEQFKTFKEIKSNIPYFKNKISLIEIGDATEEIGYNRIRYTNLLNNESYIFNFLKNDELKYEYLGEYKENEEITKKTWKNILSEQFRKLRG